MGEKLTLTYEVGELVTLAACPPGLFAFNGNIGFKSEYGSMETVGPVNIPGDQVRWRVGNGPDAYVADSGEYFWGGAKTKADRDTLIVRPLYPVEA